MSDPESSLVSINESLSFQFDKKSLLGSGASSAVHKGTFKGKDVAVKRMKEELSDDYKDLLLNIKHDNIVLVLCIESYQGLDHIVLELCLASFHQYFKKLEEVMNKFNGLTVVTKNVNRDAVRGLEYLHEQNIVHRDIKPENILLVQKSSSLEVKAVLADFGLSTKLDDDQFSKTTDDNRGTKAYMPPELLVEDGSKLRFSRQSDIFSMGCVIYFAETDGKHPFDTGDSRSYAILKNLKTYNPCDFRLLNGKPIASALIKKMIKLDRASRPSASEVLQDPYFKEDDSQDTIQVPSQLTEGEEAPQPQVDTPQDISIPPEQSVADTSYGEQLYDVMLNMSHSLPRYIVDHYIRLLAIVNVKCDMKPDWSLSKRFLELYSTHTLNTSPQVAVSYVDKILTGLGYEEMEDFRTYLHIEVEINTKITEELEKITEFRPAVIKVIRDELGPRLGDYQIDRYHMVLTVLCSIAFDSNKSFFELFTDLTGNLGKYPLAVSLTIGVLERSGWGDTKKLKPFSLPNFDLNTAYPEVDLCLTVADYYGNMSQRDFSSAKVYTSSLHLNSHNVSDMSRVQFTLLLMERGVVEAGDVSKIEDKDRYPIFFKEYKQRCKGSSKETAPTTDEAVPVQATLSQSPSTSNVSPSFFTRVKNFFLPSSDQQVQGSSNITQTNTAVVPPIPDDATLSTEEKEAIAKWLKESTVKLTVRRINMLGLPGSGKTCSQCLLLNEGPPKVDNSTPIACRAVKATRISAHDDRMEEIDANALLLRLAHDLMEAATKQKKPQPEDRSTEPMEESSETTTTESASAEAMKTEDTTESKKSPHATKSAEMTKSAELAETTKSAEVTDDCHSNKIFKNIFDAIPEAKELNRHWVYIIDSGGQTAYQELLPLFTRASSFNIVTIDISKDLDEKLDLQYRINGKLFPCGSSFLYSNIEFLKDVLSSGAILQPYDTPQSIGSEEDMTAPQNPAYFVLGTHEDKANQEVIKRYNKKLSSLTSGSEEKGYRIIPAELNGDIIYPVNTMLESGPEREAEAKNLCKIIYNNTSGDKFNLSVQEFVLELTLLEKANDRSFLPIEEVLPIGRSLQMADNETMAALEKLHNVTIILYYSKILPNKVFVDPRPILDILSRLLALTYKIHQNLLHSLLISQETYSQKEFQHELKNLQERGVFTQSLLEKLKDDEKFPKKDFIDLLLCLHIIIETDEKDEKDKKDENRKKEYFIPSALPSYPKTSQPPKSDIDPLQIIWRSSATNPKDSREILPVPRGIFSLAVINLKKSQQLQFCFPQISSQYLRYRDAMSFRVHQDIHIGTIHIIKKHKHIEIYFEGDAWKYCLLICEAVKEAISSSCEAINIKPDGYEFAFTCPSSTEGCYCIVTNENEKKVECTLCPTPPTISGEEKFWSWFDKKSLTKVKYPMMTDKFHSLLLNAVKEALVIKSIDVGNVKKCLLDLEAADWASEVDTVTDEMSLTQLLERYCFFSNLPLLKCITEKLDLKESKSRIDQLAKERDAFYSKVLAEDFAAAAIEDHKIIKEHHVEMTVVVSWPSSETTLATFQDYITKEFKDLSMFIALRAVHHSDLTFECTAPIWAAIKNAIKHAADSLKNGIQKLLLNNEDAFYEVTDLPPLKADGDAVPPVNDQEVKELECKDIDQYEMNTSPARGYCLVISMSGKKEDREPGNGKDVEKLRSLFKGTLKFAFKVYKDFSRSQIDKLMTNVQKDDHNQSSCFVMFILAHGNTDEDGDAVFYTCDKVEEEGKTVEKYNPYKVSAIKERLETTKKGLHGKPKLLFIQSCRGGTDNRGVLVRDDPNDEESNKIIPFGSDFLMSFATIKTHVSYRNIDGSPFIRHLCYVFDTYRDTHDVLSMMTIVAMRMSVWSGTTGNGLHVKQIPEFTSTLRKFLYFRDASEEN